MKSSGGAVSGGVVRAEGPIRCSPEGITDRDHPRTNQGSNTDMSTRNHLTSSAGHQLHRLRTHAHDAQRKPANSGNERDKAGTRAEGGDYSRSSSNKKKAPSGLDKYFAKMKHEETKGPEIVDRRAMLVKSASTGTIHRISMPVFRRPSNNGRRPSLGGIRSSIRSSFSRSSSRPSIPTGADPDLSGKTVRSSVSNRSSAALRDFDTNGDSSSSSPALFSSLSSRSLDMGQHGGGCRTMSESALLAMGYKKSSMTVRTLDESLGRAGPVAEQSVHRRRELRRLSNGLSRVASADGHGSTTPRGSMYDSLRRSSSVHTLNESGKSSLSVSFHNVRIREYPMTVGDNPAVSSGVAVTLGWDPLEQGSQVVEVDEYEDSRPDRRAMGQMKIPPHKRREILHRSGHSMKEMHRGLKASNIAKRQRTKTLGTLHMQPFEEMREKTSRAIGNAITSKKREERDLLARSIEAERIRERERAEVWAEQERMAAIELAEIEAIMNGEKEQQQPLQAQPVCIDEAEDDQADIFNSEFSAVSGQAAIEATDASIAPAAVKAHHANSEEQKDTPQISTPTQADNSPLERLRPASVKDVEKSSPTEIPKPDNDLEFLLISSVRREMKASSKQLEDEMLSASNELERLRGFLKDDLSTGGHQLERLSKVDIASLNNGIAKLLNNIGCFLYLERYKTSSVKVLTTSLNVLLHISSPDTSVGDDDQTLELSDVAHNLRRVLMHFILKKDIGTVGSDFTESAAIVLSNLLKAIITKESVEVKGSKRPKKNYKVDHGCDIKTASTLVRTNAELHVWQGQYDDAIVNFNVLRNLLEQRLAIEKDNAEEEVKICEEIIAVLQRMRVIYDSVYSDSSAAGICLEKIGYYRRKTLRQKVERRYVVDK